MSLHWQTYRELIRTRSTIEHVNSQIPAYASIAKDVRVEVAPFVPLIEIADDYHHYFTEATRIYTEGNAPS